MKLSYSSNKRNTIEYYPLPNGHADVFLRKNELQETDAEGNIRYVAEEVYFQIEQTVTKKDIEDNFDYMWNDAEKLVVIPTIEERLQMAEDTILFLLMSGGV